ncbi:MAG: NADH:ubiquinone reductase (Na(+)-transporting) subunit C [Flavisolibacter sp.]
MNKDSSSFTFGFAAITVIVVAVLLSFAAISLAPFQTANVRLEKMQNILSSIGVDVKPKEAERYFKQYLVQQAVLNTKGDVVKNGTAAFDIDLKKEQDKEKTGETDKQLFPLFVFHKDAHTYYVIPMRGKGLWGPIWGYLALEGDGNTIHGVSFGHKGETPGLGAEIETAQFQQQFTGKKILDDQGNFVSVKVVKGGAAPQDLHGVDAISGGTVTSNGVTEMLHRTLAYYVPYFKQAETRIATTKK